MARINVDQQALADARFARLAQLRGWADADHARGKMLLVWNECIHRGAELEVWVVDHHLGAGAAKDLLECRLAELVRLAPAIENVAGPAGTSRNLQLVNVAGTELVNVAGVPAGGTIIRIKGTDGRTDYLNKKVKAAKLGGLARAATAGRVGGKFTSQANQPLAGEVAGSHTSAPAPAPAPDLSNTGSAGVAPVDPPSDDDKAAKLQRRIDRIPERAWKAADYLRSLVLGEDPAAAVGRAKWGDDVQTGMRLGWADEFRLMVEADERTYEQIAETLRWVFKEQGPSAKFVVQSVGALRDKWDRIQAVRRNNAEKASAEKPKQQIMRIPVAGSDRR